MGLYALNPDAKVMSAAQGHADWIVATGNGGHTGASGSDETTRVYWSGYGGGKSIKCDEAWASTTSVNSAVYEAWSDWTHQQVMVTVGEIIILMSAQVLRKWRWYVRFHPGCVPDVGWICPRLQPQYSG